MGKRKIPKNLPPSEAKEFWKDGETISLTDHEKVESGPNHSWMQRGNKAYCTSCPLNHGIFLGPDQEVRDGKIVARKVV